MEIKQWRVPLLGIQVDGRQRSDSTISPQFLLLFEICINTKLSLIIAQVVGKVH